MLGLGNCYGFYRQASTKVAPSFQKGQLGFLTFLDFSGGVNDRELESEQGVPTVLSGHWGLLDVSDRVGFCNIKGKDECKKVFVGRWLEVIKK